MAAPVKVPTIFTAIDKFSPVTMKMTNSMNTFAGRVEWGAARANMALNTLTSPIRRISSMFGQFGMFVGGAAVIGGISSAIRTFAEFEQSNANLAAVLGVTIEQTAELQKNSKQLGATTAFTASQVAGLQTEFAKLGFSTDEILNSTKATLSLASATSTELPQAAKQVGSAIRAFNMAASESARVADVFAAATSKSALDMEFLEVAMSKVAPVANQFGFSIEDSTALLGKLADAGFDSSTAATSTRNIILNLADSSGKLAKALGRPVKSMPDLVNGLITLRNKGVDLASMLDLTDKRSVAAFATFLEGAESVNTLQQALQNAGGAAKAMADKQLDTLSGDIKLLKSAYEGFILSVEDGTGALGGFLRTTIQVITEVLNLMSGTQEVTSALNEKQLTIRKLAERTLFWSKAILGVVGSLYALKGILAIVRAGIFLYNTYLGINTFLTNANKRAIIGNAVAMSAFRAMVVAQTVAMGAWNIITGIVTGSLLTMKFTLLGITAPVWAIVAAFGVVVSIVASVWRNWEMIKKSFTEGGILGGIMAIGKVLIDAVLAPLQTLLELASNIPGVGDLAGRGANRIFELRESLDLNADAPEINNQADRDRTITEKLEKTTSGNLNINLNDPGGMVQSQETSGNIPIEITSTMSQY